MDHGLLVAGRAAIEIRAAGMGGVRRAYPDSCASAVDQFCGSRPGTRAYRGLMPRSTTTRARGTAAGHAETFAEAIGADGPGHAARVGFGRHRHTLLRRGALRCSTNQRSTASAPSAAAIINEPTSRIRSASNT